MNENNIKQNLIKEIENLIHIIKKEYPNLVDIPENYNLEERVHIKSIGTISLYVENKNFYFPLEAFKILNKLKKIPGFGSNKNHQTRKNNEILNNNTYLSYIKHVFLKGLTPEEYFKEILLHETFHFCGSGGAFALREGINELKTRQLAQKYNLLTSYCGYPKETKIAYELEKIFGKEIVDQIAFSKSNAEIKTILDKISLSAAPFYFKLEEIMENEFHHKYMKYKFPGLTGPLKKAKKYNSLNYKDAYILIEQYKKNFKNNKPKIQKQEERKKYITDVLINNSYINEQKPKQK